MSLFLKAGAEAGRPPLNSQPMASSNYPALGAGMLAGALGKGVPYPIDTIKTKQQIYAGSGGSINPISLVSSVLKAEGLSGFYGGVSSTMAGEAVIKGAVFFTYDFFNALLGPASQLNMVIAAAISGAVASVVATPVERVKCVKAL